MQQYRSHSGYHGPVAYAAGLFTTYIEHKMKKGGMIMSDDRSRPLYENEFEKYTMAVALLGTLFKEGVLPKEVYDKIKKEYDKEVEKYRELC